MKSIKILLCLLVCVIIFSSCNFDNSTNNLKGGELLNDEKISQIKSEILSEQHVTTENETDDKTESLSDEKNESTVAESEEEISADHGEGTEDQSDLLENTETSDTSTENEIYDESGVVYWLDGGSVWHLYRDCRHIKNTKKEILSGSIDDAKEMGAENVCKTCDKKSETE